MGIIDIWAAVCSTWAIPASASPSSAAAIGKRLIKELTAAFPDHHTKIEDLVAEGDRVAVRVTFSGTHEGDFRGMPATGRSFSQMQMHLVALDDQGRATDHWAVREDLGMMNQLSLLPPRTAD